MTKEQFLRLGQMFKSKHPNDKSLAIELLSQLTHNELLEWSYLNNGIEYPEYIHLDTRSMVKAIQSCCYKTRNLQNMTEKELYDVASDMSSQLEECIEYIHLLEKSKEYVYFWAIENYEKLNEINKGKSTEICVSGRNI